MSLLKTGWSFFFPLLIKFCYYLPIFRAKIEGCTLGRSTHIGAKSQLTKTVTQPGYEVEAGGKPFHHQNQSRIMYFFLQQISRERS